MKVASKMSRSVYGFKYPVKGSFNLGEICPIGAPIEIIPYDELKADCGIVIRMATPIAPLMDDLDAEITAHFVPLRLIGNVTVGDITNQGQALNQTSTTTFEKIIGNGLGNPADWMVTDNEQYSVLTTTWNAANARAAQFTSIGEALGLGLGTGTSKTQNINAMPLMGYNLIYQERFRNQNVEAAKPNLLRGSNLYGASGTNTATTGTWDSYNQSLSVAYKHGDYFTNAVPSPTKGAAVQIPLGTTAPIITSDTITDLGDYNPIIRSSNFDSTGDTSLIYGVTADSAAHNGVLMAGADSSPSGLGLTNISATNLVADLKAATAATVNSFIEAYNIQRLLMKDIKGTRYFDIIKNHFGVINDDIRLYIPELLNIRRFSINISPVVQQSGSAAATSSTDQGNFLGTTGGYSFTANKGSLVHKAFGEFGYVYFLICIRQRHTYGQGIPKLFLRSKRFDFFFPELGRIGYQAIDNVQLNADVTIGNGVFGYQPAWQELREVNQAQAFGFLNPSKTNSLDYWTLTESYSATPQLEMAFLKENRTNLARALTIGSTGPDFIMDAMIYGKKSTLVPIGSEPKLFN